MLDFIITLFFGIFGVHKFKKGQIGLGILYFFTYGLFLIGWIYDCIIAFKNISKSNSINSSRTSLVDNCFYVAGIDHYRENFIPLLKKADRGYSDYAYRIKRADVLLIPEPTNSYDKNAIQVIMEGVLVGYVPSELTKYIKPIIKKKNFTICIYRGDVFYNERLEQRPFIGRVEFY